MSSGEWRVYRCTATTFGSDSSGLSRCWPTVTASRNSHSILVSTATVISVLRSNKPSGKHPRSSNARFVARRPGTALRSIPSTSTAQGSTCLGRWVPESSEPRECHGRKWSGYRLRMAEKYPSLPRSELPHARAALYRWAALRQRGDSPVDAARSDAVGNRAVRPSAALASAMRQPRRREQLRGVAGRATGRCHPAAACECAAGDRCVPDDRPGCSGEPEYDAHLVLHTATVTAWDVVCQGLCRGRSAEEYAPRTRIAFPYRGVYVHSVGGLEHVGEPNQVVVINEDQPYRVSHPVAGGDATLTIGIDPATLLELTPPEYRCRGERAALNRSGFRIDARTQVMAAHLRQRLARRS